MDNFTETGGEKTPLRSKRSKYWLKYEQNTNKMAFGWRTRGEEILPVENVLIESADADELRNET